MNLNVDLIQFERRLARVDLTQIEGWGKLIYVEVRPESTKIKVNCFNKGRL